MAGRECGSTKKKTTTKKTDAGSKTNGKPARRSDKACTMPWEVSSTLGDGKYDEADLFTLDCCTARKAGEPVKLFIVEACSEQFAVSAPGDAITPKRIPSNVAQLSVSDTADSLFSETQHSVVETDAEAEKPFADHQKAPPPTNKTGGAGCDDVHRYTLLNTPPVYEQAKKGKKKSKKKNADAPGSVTGAAQALLLNGAVVVNGANTAVVGAASFGPCAAQFAELSIHDDSTSASTNAPASRQQRRLVPKAVATGANAAELPQQLNTSPPPQNQIQQVPAPPTASSPSPSPTNNNSTSASTAAGNQFDAAHHYRLPPAVAQQPLSRLDQLSAQVYEFHHQNEQSMSSLSEKLHLRDLLYNVIAPHFAGCGLYIVGSTLNGFGSNSSDMDLCLMITPRDLDQRVDAILVLTSVMGYLKDSKYVKDMDLIFAKVPILRATFHPPFDRIVVDLNANNSVAIRNTHLLCYYSAFDWRVRPLVCAVKEWAKRRGINDANQSSLTSYSLVMMVIHYLQCGVNPSILPSLQQLYPDRFGNKIDVRSLNISVPLEHTWDSDRNPSSLGDLLLGCLQYYARCFNFDTMAISVRLGRAVDRAYVAKNKSPFNSLSQWRCICIEEPFTYSNTAHSVFDERVFSCIKQSFEEAYISLAQERDIDTLLYTEPIRLNDGVPSGFRHFRVPVIRYDRENHEATEKQIVATVASFHLDKAK